MMKIRIKSSTISQIWAALFVAVVVTLVAMTGCGGDFGCSDACDKIYGECQGAMTVQGQPVSKPQCLSICESGQQQDPAQTDQILSCLESSACSQIDSCFN